MHDLRGIDTVLVQQSISGRTAMESSLLGSLMSGAFISDHSHSKYDLGKSSTCDVCGVQADVLHRTTCPKFASITDAIAGWTGVHPLDTDTLRTHLLPSRSPWAIGWKTYLMRVEDSSSFAFSCPSTGIQHVFSDGTCAGDKPYRYAAWGCLNATTGEPIAAGILPGLTQSSDRAELTGALAVLKWQVTFQCDVHLWLDCKFVSDGLCFLLQHGYCGVWSNSDLWEQVAELMQQLGDLLFQPHWIPSHLDSKRTECPFEDWVCDNNNKVDAMIGFYNHNRGDDFRRLLASATTHHEQMKQRMNQLARFHFDVAASSKTAEQTSADSEPEVSLINLGNSFVSSDTPNLTLLYNIDVSELLAGIDWDESIAPKAFLFHLLSWLFSLTSEDAPVIALSFIEVGLAVASCGEVMFPFKRPSDGTWALEDIRMRFEKPTLAYVFRIVKAVLVRFLSLVDLSGAFCAEMNKVELRIMHPTPGLYMRLPLDNRVMFQDRVLAFTSRRPIRRASDLAQPC